MTEQISENQLTKDSAADLKTKVVLSTPIEHPFSRLQQGLKDRGVKGYDLNAMLLAALDAVPGEWWDQKLEELTPLEFRVNAALSNPELREKLQDLLAPRH